MLNRDLCVFIWISFFLHDSKLRRNEDVVGSKITNSKYKIIVCCYNNVKMYSVLDSRKL